MPRPKKPAPENRPRLHFINEWAERRGMGQPEIAESLGVERSTVFRWFEGALPSEAALPRIAAMFGIELYELFREPADDWVKQLFEDRSQAESLEIKRTVEFHHPKKVA